MGDYSLEDYYEDRTYITDDDNVDYYDEFLPDHCKECGEHYIDCLCDFPDIDEVAHIGEY